MKYSPDILETLRIDPGQRTLGQLLQDREAAAHEIRRLRAESERRSIPRFPAPPKPEEQKSESSLPRPMLIRLNELCELIGVSRSTVYRWLSTETFPQPVRIGQHAVRWRMADVEAWQDAL